MVGNIGEWFSAHSRCAGTLPYVVVLIREDGQFFFSVVVFFLSVVGGLCLSLVVFVVGWWLQFLLFCLFLFEYLVL